MNIEYDAMPQSMTFVGRQTELAHIAERLSAPSCRLLTLVGPGGIGKTRLALEAAQRFTFPDGVYFVPLQPLIAADYALSAIAKAVGCYLQAHTDPHQQLIDHFHSKSLLLVLDNLEHLMDAADLLSAILSAAPDVRMLVTSRTRLNLAEAWTLDVGGLGYPAGEVDSDIEDYEAVQLFLHHARRVKADFELTEAQKSALIRICRLVEGMPLAIELAAVWVRALPCDAIADEIEHSLDILEASARNVEPRHRTMRAALDHSWYLLNRDERDVFKKLSVFRGGFTRAAARQVAGAALRTLAALVDKSLIRLSENGRYDLHELLRQYAGEKLDISPVESQQTHDSHCAYYADIMSSLWQPLRDRRQKAAMTEIQNDLDNIQAAWQWAVDNTRTAQIQMMLDSLWFFYDARMEMDVGLRALQAAINAISESEHPLLYGRLLARQGMAFRIIGRSQQARERIERSLTIFRSLHSREDIAYGLMKLGELETDQENYGEASRIFDDTLAIYEELNDRWNVTWVLYWHSLACRFSSDFDQATKLAEKSLSFFEQIGYQGGTAASLAVLGECAYFRGKYGVAIEFHRKQLTSAREAENRWQIMESQLGLGLAYLAMGKRAEALPLLHKGLIEARDIHLRCSAVAYLLVDFAPVFAARGEPAVALVSFAHHKPYEGLPPFIESRSQQFLEEMKSQMSPADFAAEMERGKVLDLRTTVEWLIAQIPTLQEEAQPESDILRPRELEVLRLIDEGLSNQEIAQRLVLSVSTVKWYVNEIFGKLHVTNRTQAASRARSLGLMS